MAKQLPPGIQSREHAPRGTTRKRTQYRAFVSDKTRKTGSGRVARLSSTWFDTLAEAREWRDQVLEQQRGGTLAASRGLTVGDACDAWLRAARRMGHQGRDPIRATTEERQASAIRGVIKCLVYDGKDAEGKSIYVRGVGEPIDLLRMADLGAPDIRKWLDACLDIRSRLEVVRALEILKQSYDYAIELGQLRANPASSIRLSKRSGDDDDDVGVVSEFMQPEEVARILRGADDLATKGHVGELPVFERNESFGHLKTRARAWASRYRPLVYFLLGTGVRIGEGIGIQWKHIDLDNGIVHIEQSANQKGVVGPPKTKSSIRHIPIGPVVVEILRNMPGKHDPNHFVFGGDTPTKAPNRRNLYGRCWVTLMTETGMVEKDGDDVEVFWSFHDCRHFFASLLIDQGTEPQQVCDLLGHANVTTTLRIYTHLFKAKRGRMNKAARQLENIILGLPAPAAA